MPGSIFAAERQHFADETGPLARPREEVAAERDALASAREIVCVNAVRGARAVVELDGSRVATGGTGPAATRLDAYLARAGDLEGPLLP